MSTRQSASFLYLQRDPLHLTEKPYKLRYDPGDEYPRTNINNETVDSIVVDDLRECNDTSFESSGFTWVDLKSILSVDDFYDESKVRETYYTELRNLLHKVFDPDRIEIVEHRVRKRQEMFPIAEGGEQDWKILPPTTIVHLDYTPESAEELGKNMLDVPRDRYNRLLCLNLWKPLRGPVTDWPLALCDPHSVDADTDATSIDVVFRDSYTENTQFYFNPKHKWYYLSNQMDTEVTIFRQYDSDLPAGQGVPHSAFEIAYKIGAAKPRESIEVRVCLYYE